MARLILLTAVPGAGKSTWADEYCKNHKNVLIVSSDEIRKEIGGSYQCFSNEKKVWDLFLERANEHALDEDTTVILDSVLINDYYRKLYFDMTPNFRTHELVLINVSYEIAKSRNRNRDIEKVVPESILEKMFYEFEQPSDKIISLFDVYKKIDVLQ